MEYQLDLRAYLCPLPLLMTKNAVKQLVKGESLTVFLNRQTSLADFSVWCESAKFNLSVLDEQDASMILKIQV